MHWLDEGIDTGDIFHRERLQLREGESADDLYQRTMELEVKVFRDSMKMLLAGQRARTPQVGMGSYHKKADFERLISAVRTSDTLVVRR
jgi:methionyl-tRNA formyltransferase